MTQEFQKQNQGQESSPRIPQKVIEKILSGNATFNIPEHNEPVSFELMYKESAPSGNGLPKRGKYQLAIQLIETGYADIDSLAKHYLTESKDYQPTSEQRQEDLELNDRLNFLVKNILVQRRELKVNSADMQDAAAKFETNLEASLDRNPIYSDLVTSGVPPEILGLMKTAEDFAQLTDQEKIEEMRSWTTRSMLRWYLGKLEGSSIRREPAARDILDRLPKKIFDDPQTVGYTLTERYFEHLVSDQLKIQGYEECLKDIAKLAQDAKDPAKKALLEKLHTRFTNITTLQPKGDFKKEIVVKDELKPFPSPEQLSFMYDFTHSDTRLATGDTGSGKTGAAFVAMEESDATKVLVLAPASGRQTWVDQDKTLFQHPGQVFAIEGSADISLATQVQSKYIVISRELLGDADNNPALAQQLYDLVEKTGMNGAIIDEITDFSNPKATSTKIAFRLLSIIRENYTKKTRLDNAPVIGLTATPIRSDLSDLNVTMAMLYPNEYVATIGKETDSKKTFSDTYLKRPDLAYMALTGQRKMNTWSTPSDVQALEYEPILIRISPFERMLVEYIGTEIGSDPLTKIRLQEDAMLDPLLVKGALRELSGDKIPPIDIDQVLGELKKVLSGWQELRGVQLPTISDDYLDVDKLVELGFNDLVLRCFASEVLERGIDTLVAEFTKNTTDPDLQTLAQFWKPKPLSTKYQVLRNIVQESLTWQTDSKGESYRNKVMVISPGKVQGRTRKVLPKTKRSATEQSGRVLSTYEQQVLDDTVLADQLKAWVEGVYMPEAILLIDGQSPIGNRRNKIIDLWVNDPDHAMMLVNAGAMYKSRDLTITQVKDIYGRRIAGLDQILLHYDWDWEGMKQLGGRSLRIGQRLPSRSRVLHAINTVDEGKADKVRYTKLLTSILLSGVKLTSDDYDFFHSKLTGKNRIRLQSPEARFLVDTFNFVRGAGAAQIDQFMQATAPKEERTNAQKFAERFYDGGKDEFRESGYNAELVASIIKHFESPDSKILSLGAGTLLLQRKLKRGIDNVDLNTQMMYAGWEAAGIYGGSISEGKIADLDPDRYPNEKYDFVDNAFALHWSKLDGESVDQSERVQILSQMNRITKTDGTIIITLPQGYFDDDTFAKFTRELENSFGFKIRQEFSGKSYGVNKMGAVKRIGWCLVANKISNVKLENVDLSSLAFLGEDGKWTSNGLKPKRDDLFVKTTEYPSPDLRLEFEKYQIVGREYTATILPKEGLFNMSDYSDYTTNENLDDKAGDEFEDLHNQIRRDRLPRNRVSKYLSQMRRHYSR